MEAKPERRGPKQAYWDGRSRLLYYQVVQTLVNGLGAEARSILDVGSANCPYLDWFPHIPERVSVDLRNPYRGPGVTPVKANFLDWTPAKRFDIVTCLQVLEHIADAEGFARKLLDIGDIVVISVPYQWRPGRAKTHVQDPVDEAKVRSWFGREPNYAYFCREVTSTDIRLVHVYERTDVAWQSLRGRESLMARGYSTTLAGPAPKRRRSPPQRLVRQLRKWVRRAFTTAVAKRPPQGRT